MFKFIEFLKARPSDMTIRYSRLAYWLILLALLVYNFNNYTIALPNNIQSFEIYLRYTLCVVPFVPIFMWAVDFCIAKRKTTKKIQMLFWIFLIFMWIFWIITESPKAKVTDWKTVDMQVLVNEWKWKSTNIWTYLVILWLFPLIWWATWKCITKKCLKYKEVITKIRV